MSDYGLLQEVIVVPRGSSLTAGAIVTDTDLVVDSAGDFDEDGGTLQLNGAQLEYTGITWGVTEDDSDTITLADPLAVAADEDDAVAPVIGGLVAEDWYAVVDMGPGDAVHIPLSYAQRVLWPEGIYSDVPVVVSDDLQRIEDAPGRPASGSTTASENRDTLTVSGPGDQTFPLSRVPDPLSLDVYWEPLHVPVSFWTLDGSVLTVLDPNNRLQAGDLLSAVYHYNAASAATEETVNIVPFEAAGWKYKQVSLADTTDYSSASYDDSAWSVGTAAFGSGGTLGSPATNWTKNTSLWLRRDIGDVMDLTITVKVEDNCEVYVNGTLVGTAAPAVPESSHPWYDNPFVVAVPNSVLTSSAAVIAIRCNDDVTDLPAPDNTYADVYVEGRYR